jgi:hypothetical protein
VATEVVPLLTVSSPSDWKHGMVLGSKDWLEGPEPACPRAFGGI